MKRRHLILAVILAVAMAGAATADITFSGGAGSGSPACGTLSSPGAEGFCWNYEVAPVA